MLYYCPCYPLHKDTGIASRTGGTLYGNKRKLLQQFPTMLAFQAELFNQPHLRLWFANKYNFCAYLYVHHLSSQAWGSP